MNWLGSERIGESAFRNIEDALVRRKSQSIQAFEIVRSDGKLASRGLEAVHRRRKFRLLFPPFMSVLMPECGSVNQIEPSDLHRMSIGRVEPLPIETICKHRRAIGNQGVRQPDRGDDAPPAQRFDVRAFRGGTVNAAGPLRNKAAIFSIFSIQLMEKQNGKSSVETARLTYR